MVLDSRRVITLAHRGVLSLEPAAGTFIECTRGCLWLTEDGCSEDIVLLPGDAWQASGRRPVLASALRETVFSVREPLTPRPARGVFGRLRVLLGSKWHPMPGASASA
jgi:hypothetical protein